MKRVFLFVVFLLSFSLIATESADNEKCGCNKPPREDEVATVVPQPVVEESEACPLEQTKPTTVTCTASVCTITHQDVEKEVEKCPCAGGTKPRQDEKAKCPCSGTKPRAAVLYNIYDYLHNKVSCQSNVKCPCSVKPSHKVVAARVCGCMTGNNKTLRLEEVLDKCSCGKPRPAVKDPNDGAQLFLQGTQAIMFCVTGGIVAHNSGDLKIGLAYVIEGIMSFVDLASRSKNPEAVRQELCKFMAGFDQQDMDQLLHAANTHALLQAAKRTA